MAKTSILGKFGGNLTTVYRSTVLSLFQLLYGRMAPQYEQFWIVLFTANQVGVNAKAIAGLTGLRLQVVMNYINHLATLGYVKNGKIVPNFMALFTARVIGPIGGAGAGTAGATTRRRARGRGGKVIPLGKAAVAA